MLRTDMPLLLPLQWAMRLVSALRLHTDLITMMRRQRRSQLQRPRWRLSPCRRLCTADTVTTVPAALMQMLLLQCQCLDRRNQCQALEECPHRRCHCRPVSAHQHQQLEH